VLSFLVPLFLAFTELRETQLFHSGHLHFLELQLFHLTFGLPGRALGDFTFGGVTVTLFFFDFFLFISFSESEPQQDVTAQSKRPGDPEPYPARKNHRPDRKRERHQDQQELKTILVQGF
jgi:hypothetical protein